MSVERFSGQRLARPRAAAPARRTGAAGRRLAAVLLAAVAAGGTAGVGCGKKGPPLAPLRPVPARIDDLIVRRLEDDIYLRFTIPSRNQDGTTPADLSRVEVYAITGPPEDQFGRSLDGRGFARYGTRVATIEVEPPPPPAREDEPPAPPPAPDPRPAQGEAVTVIERLTPAVMTPWVHPKRAEVERKRKEEEAGRASTPWVGPLVPRRVEVLSRVYVAAGRSRRGELGPLSARLAVPLTEPPDPPGAPAIAYTEQSLVLSWTPPPTARRPVQEPASARPAAPAPSAGAAPAAAGSPPESVARAAAPAPASSQPVGPGAAPGPGGAAAPPPAASSTAGTSAAAAPATAGAPVETGGPAGVGSAGAGGRPTGMPAASKAASGGAGPGTGASATPGQAGSGAPAAGQVPAPPAGGPAAPAAEPPPLPGRPTFAGAIPHTYNVYRVAPAGQEGAVVMPVPLNPRPLEAPRFEETPVAFGVERCYVVRMVEVVGLVTVESAPSPPACVTPRDTFPPAAPRNLAAVASEGAISLIWEANGEPDLAGYLVLRGEAGSGRLDAITPSPIRETTFRDERVSPGMRYVYAVVAVDTAAPANVSAESNRVEETAR